ncbi:ComEC/Rec2 family competence protein [Clostridium vincentii]|uniref:ComEC family competence protein n=1 Tax=Clostridium vincentii TaxID=52704 RepID=A0A2T0BCQ1_9CLOT|nr:MBL fold metallo-hydrolase [Clostridium vincentii]PRR81680.1 ComEC family competence protein [Clostridium vincentii]
MYKKIINIFGWSIFLLIIFFGYWSIHLQNTKKIKQGMPVEISFLGLKEDADCILVQQGEVNVVIDTGEKQDTQKILSYLKRKNVSSIEFLILTHPDKDHIGGAVEIIDNFEVKNIVQPYYAKENEQLEILNKKIEIQGIPIIYPTVTRKFSVGEMNILVYPPLEKHYTKDNNYSLATLIKHGKVNMLFAGDAEKKRIGEMLLINWENIDLFKIPHHGRANINSEEFIRKLSPTYAVVTSNNADEIIKETCEETNTQVFYTGTGDKIFQSNGDVLQLQDDD